MGDEESFVYDFSEPGSVGNNEGGRVAGEKEDFPLLVNSFISVWVDANGRAERGGEGDFC